MFSKFKRFYTIIAIISALSISGCSIPKIPFIGSKDASGTSFFQDSPQKLYSIANRKMQSGKYDDALESYNEFIVKYPFGSLSEKGRLERIFVLNKLNETEEAELATDQFVDQYPLHPNIDYAYFMRGIIQFEKKRSGLGRRFGGAVEVDRNKSRMEKSFNAFQDLITKYPNSQYVPDAQLRMTFLRNKMAEHEFGVAKFYAKRNANIGVINRCKYIIENFEQSPAVIDALNLMVITYNKMDLPELANEAQAILDANYKGIKGIEGEVAQKQKKPSIWSRIPTFKIPNLNPFKKSKT